MSYRKHIDDFFREKLGNYKETPPPEAWGELEERLDGLVPSVPGSPYRLFRHVAIISLLAVLGISAVRKLAGNPGGNTMGTAGNTTGTAGQNAAPVAATATGSATTQQSVAATNNNNSTAGNTGNTSGSQPSGSNNSQVAAVATSGNHNPKMAGANKLNGHYLAAKMSNHTTPLKLKGKGRHAAGTTSQATTDKDTNSSTVAATNIDISDYNSAASPDLALSTKPAQGDILPGTFKNGNAPKSSIAAPDKAAPVVKTGAANEGKAGFRRFEAGVKAGFEFGASNGAAQKLSVAPYLQYNLSPKFALMTQPGVKFAHVAAQNVGNPKSYYSANNDGKTVIDSTYNYANTIGPGIVVNENITRFKYSESHDSIVKSYKYGGNYMEVELPILLKYQITGKASVYGGVNLVYSQLPSITESSSTTKGIIKSVTRSDTSLPGQTVSQPDLGVTYSGTSIQEYKNQYPTKTGGQLMAGYMLGFSYQCNRKWLLDAMVQQAPVNTTGTTASTTQSTTYFRFSIGYKLTK